MDKTLTMDCIRIKYAQLESLMNERMRRHWAASEALVLGYGGISLVSQATGLSRTTITTGIQELQEGSLSSDSPERSRRSGGGRPALIIANPELVEDLEALVAPTTRGDPMSPLRWTCKSTRLLAEELNQKGHAVSHQTVATLLWELDYSLQATRKTREGMNHPDRDAQFQYINQQVLTFQRQGQPVISVDAKKKENIGNFANSGREYQPKHHPEEVRAKDFPDKQLGKALPYGIYDLKRNEGWVSVGVDHDTAEFAVQSIRRWWEEMGCLAYPRARKLLVTADSGGSNSSRTRLWKLCLQELASEMELPIHVCHFPPGTSKWNKIEHRMFCHITKNWRGRPLVSRAVIVNLIGSTKTQTGLRIRAELDPGSYPIGKKVPDDLFEAIRLTKNPFHGDWNYTIKPE